jgi:hypothetical protein
MWEGNTWFPDFLDYDQSSGLEKYGGRVMVCRRNVKSNQGQHGALL